MLRRTVLYLFRDTATAAERAQLLWALSYAGLECPAVAHGDYGDDIAGGSQRLVDVPPWERTPRFHARAEGPPSNYDAALHLDFEDEAALAAFEAHPAAQEVEDYAASVTVPDVTARLDWRYEGAPRIRRGGYRHVALHVWREGADRAPALKAARTLGAVGESAAGDAAGFDWILDVELADEDAARSFLASRAYAAAAATIAAATKHEWTARVTHLARGS
jgi:hypothetical protein